MCGINGFSWGDKRRITRMDDAIAHRGPDGSGVYVDRNVSLGHRRLAVIDLSAAARQPMRYTHAGRTVIIVFNGEIYNYQDVRKELESRGFRFRTRSDTEVILAAYIAWGDKCVDHFNGMWAFCIYDLKRKVLFCSRDRAGEKPFYYAHTAIKGKKRFIFGSELKAFYRHPELALSTPANIDSTAVGLYFSLGFIPAPLTIYRNIRKLPAAHNLIFDIRKGTLKTWRYYDVPAYNPEYDRKRLLAEGRELLKDAVRLRMIADVPVGAFLSGGLDSSAVVAEMATLTDRKRLHTFSVGFKGKYDETPYAHIVKDAFGTRHHHTQFTRRDFDRCIEDYAQTYDEPFGDQSGFPMTHVSALARKDVTVVLSGDGGDEIFGGYETYVTGKRFEDLRKVPRFLRHIGSRIPVRKNLNATANPYLLKRAFELSLHEPDRYFEKSLEGETIKSDAFKEWSRYRLAKALAKSGNSLPEAMRLYDLLYATVPDLYLVKVDRASMTHGLEVRAPFLDYRLIEYAQRIPAEWKIDRKTTKKFMRELVRGIVPEGILNRRKQGFRPPIEDWMQEPAYESTMKDGLVTLEKIDPELASDYRSVYLVEDNRTYRQYRVRLFLFSLWWKRWMQSARTPQSSVVQRRALRTRS